MRAVVLVGGEGTRLRPLTYDSPKPLLSICNVPFVEWQLAWLEHHGISEVVLALGYLADPFVEHFADGRFRSLDLRYAVEDRPLGTAGAIRFALDEVGGAGERVVVCNGDILTGLDLTSLVKAHDDRGAAATIALTQVADPTAFGVVPIDERGDVVAFVEKPAPGEAPTDWVNAGTYVLEPEVLARIPAGRNVSIERETFPSLIGRGLSAVRSPEYWIDIGTPEKLLQAQLDVLGGAMDGLDLVVAPGLHAMPATKVVRAEGVEVAPGARVESSVLGARCVIGADACVTRSMVLEGACVGERAVVVDSIVGRGAHVGAGATLSDVTVVGSGERVADGSRLVGARVGMRGGDA